LEPALLESKADNAPVAGEAPAPHHKMPLYEYLCQKCGHRFERIQRFSDPMVKKCPDCGGKVEQVISAPAVQFKGSGWYVTDYAKKPSAGSNSKGESESKKSDSDSKSDSGKDSGKKESKSKAESSSKSSEKK
jgi:putative FmdB family regulatory protein